MRSTLLPHLTNEIDSERLRDLLVSSKAGFGSQIRVTVCTFTLLPKGGSLLGFLSWRDLGWEDGVGRKDKPWEMPDHGAGTEGSLRGQHYSQPGQS